MAGNAFLDSFIRGDRDNEDRRGSVAAPGHQPDERPVRHHAHPLERAGLQPSDQELAPARRQFVTNLFLAVLSRYPGDSEIETAHAALAGGNRNIKAENLLWSPYNKVDFFINY